MIEICKNDRSSILKEEQHKNVYAMDVHKQKFNFSQLNTVAWVGKRKKFLKTTGSNPSKLQYVL